MEFRRNFLAVALIFWFFFFSPIASDPLSFSEAISGLKETVAQALKTGVGEEWEITRFDPRDASVIQSLVYEFHIQIGKTVFPIRLLEDLNNSSNIFWDDEDNELAPESGILDIIHKSRRVSPVLSPFQLAGPLELWIQDGDNLRLALPNDVDAGVLRKVVLADGATVTVKGARSVSLKHPIEFQLPVNHTHPYRFISLSALSEAIRQDSRTVSSNKHHPLVSLRIEGPTSITTSSSSSPSSSSNNARLKLKLKRLAPGLVELSSLALATSGFEKSEDDTPEKKTSWWPFASINASDPNLMGIEALLGSVLGKKAGKVGSFQVVKAEVSAKTYVKQRFRMVKRLTNEDIDLMGLPEWKTKPVNVQGYFEVVGRVEDNGEVIAEKIVQVEEPFQQETSFHPNLLTGNVSSIHDDGIINPPQSFFTL